MNIINELLNIAVINGNIPMTESILGYNPNINFRYHLSRNRILHIAVSAPSYHASRFDIVRLLIARGADVNGEGVNNNTPLHVAVRLGDIAMARLLIEEYNANINSNNPGYTPLHLAVSRGDLNMVSLLINSNGINIDSQDSDGNTPLHLAASREHRQIIDLLLEGRANRSILNSQGRAPYKLAKTKEMQDYLHPNKSQHK